MAIPQVKDVDGWSKAKWGMTEPELIAAFTNGPDPVSRFEDPHYDAPMPVAVLRRLSKAERKEREFRAQHPPMESVLGIKSFKVGRVRR